MRWKDKETVLVLLLDTKSRLIKPLFKVIMFRCILRFSKCKCIWVDIR